jgi:hypothetical protein
VTRNKFEQTNEKFSYIFEVAPGLSPSEGGADASLLQREIAQ